MRKFIVQRSLRGLAASAAAALLVAGFGLSSVAAVSGATSNMQPAKTKVTCTKNASCFIGVNSGAGAGVEGDNQGYSTSSYGVVGTSLAGIGVYGSGQNTYGGGVEGFSISGFGVEGGASSGNGVTGVSTSGAGLSGTSSSGYGVYGTSQSIGGAFFNTGVASGPTLVAEAESPYSFPFEAVNTTSGAFFYVDTAGDGYFSGGVYTHQAPMIEQRGRDGGRAGTFGTQSTRATLEDTGTAHMSNGEAAVRFDPAYARLLDFSHGYQVFLTPDGDTRGLFVAAKFEGGFMVREIEHGRSSIYFDYRVVAHPFGATDERLPQLSFRPPTLPKPPASVKLHR